MISFGLITTGSALAGASMRYAFDRLTPAHRDILSQVYVHGRSIDEVAELLGVPVGTVKSRTHYALRALRTGLEAA